MCKVTAFRSLIAGYVVEELISSILENSFIIA